MAGPDGLPPGRLVHLRPDRQPGRPPPQPDRPELQHLVAGEVVPDAARNYAYWIAARVQPPTTLVYTTTRQPFSQRSFGPGDPVPKTWYQASWAFVLEAPDPDTTRLLVRWRMTCVPRRAGLLLMWLLLGPGDLLMQRKLLQTIRRLVERHGAQVPLAPAAATAPLPAKRPRERQRK